MRPHKWPVALTAMLLAGTVPLASAHVIERPVEVYSTHTDSYSRGRNPDLRDQLAGLDPSFELLPRSDQGGQSGYFYKHGLFVPRKYANQRTRKILDASISGRNMTVLSFLHDKNLNTEIRRNASQSDGSKPKMKYGVLPESKKEIQDLLDRLTGQLVVVVAHSESDRLVRLKAGSHRQVEISIAEIMQAAKSAKINLFLYTCGGASKGAGPGPIGTVWPWEIGKAIREARRADTYATYLAAFGTDTNPMIVSGIEELDNGLVRVDVNRNIDSYTFSGKLTAASPPLSPPNPTIEPDLDGHYPDPAVVLFDIFAIYFLPMIVLGGIAIYGSRRR